MAYQLPVGKTVTLQVIFVDELDHPAGVDGGISWSISDAIIASITSDPNDQTKAFVTALGVLGQAQVQASAQVSGVSIVALFDLEAIAAAAVSGSIKPVSDL